jgi:hypothetical protein
MIASRLMQLAACAAMVSLLAACGGGGELGGTLTGLGAGLTVTVQNNGADTLMLSSNGPFTFASRLASSSAYAVTILTQPVGQECVVSNGTGTVDSNGGSVNNVEISCTDAMVISGTVTGLLPGTAVILSDGAVQLPVAVDGPFAFPGTPVNGAAYAIVVASQPLGKFCTVANGTGTYTAGVATNIQVVCN